MTERREEHEKYGSTITGSRWFNEEPEITEQEVKTFTQRWMCPIKDCDGEMRFNGVAWPMVEPGYHHTCVECGFTAAVEGKQYPREVHRP